MATPLQQPIERLGAERAGWMALTPGAAHGGATPRRGLSPSAGTNDPPFKAIRPEPRVPQQAPGFGAMSLEELSQAFYNLLAQFHVEQHQVSHLGDVLGAHAANLELAETAVSKLTRDQGEITRDWNSRVTVDIQNLYNRITEERMTEVHHMGQKTALDRQNDLKVLYTEMNKERVTHVGQSEEILKVQINNLNEKTDKTFRDLEQAILDTRNLVSGSAPFPAPPGIGHDVHLQSLDSSITALGAAHDQSQKDLESVNNSLKSTLTELEVRMDVTIREMNAQLVAMSAQTAQAFAASDVFQHVPWVPGAAMNAGPAAAPPTGGVGFGSTTGSMPPLHASHPAGTWSWKLYDEKYLQSAEHSYDAKNPQGWLWAPRITSRGERTRLRGLSTGSRRKRSPLMRLDFGTA